MVKGDTHGCFGDDFSAVLEQFLFVLVQLVSKKS